MKVVNKTTLTDGAQTLRFWMGETISGMHRRPANHILPLRTSFFFVRYCYIILLHHVKFVFAVEHSQFSPDFTTFPFF